MTHSTKLLSMIILALVTLASQAVAETDEFAEARAQRRAFTDQFMKAILAAPNPPAAGKTDSYASVFAMAGLYTGEQIEAANQRLRNALKLYAGDDGKLTPKEATKIKWKMRGWLRVYYLFYDKSKFFPGRLEPETQAMMEEAFFQYGCGKSTVKRANLTNIWHIQGSENHDMMDLSSAYLALQAVAKLPAYKDRKLPDGHTPAEHVEAWEKYYAQYALERAKNGLFVEISPTYGKWFLGEILNMYEFAEDPVVRKRMEMLLHLVWADWSVDQLNGVRGGGKTRCYQGGYSQSGGGDSWDRMARHLMGIEPWIWPSHGGLSTLAISTSRYELPDIVYDIALNKGDFKPFVYQSTRPAKQLKSPRGVYVMDPKAGGIVRYSFCTPDYVMGSWMVDTRTNYAAINTQNRWQGVIFPTGVNARVFPQSVGLGNRKTYQQHVAVQHRNVMLVATHPKARQTGQMRVYFPKDIRDRLVEKDGWLIAHEGNAWLAVRFIDFEPSPTWKNYEFKQADPTERKESSRNDSDVARWLWPKSNKPAVVMVGSRDSQHATLDEFVAYLAGHEFTVTSGRVTYKFSDDLGEATTLELGGKLPVPRVNGKPANLNPEKVFDSPYLHADQGSGIVTLEKGQRKRTLDFTDSPKHPTTGANVSKTTVNAKEQTAFDQADAAQWKQVFADDCTGDWKEQWFLDGEVGTVTTGPDGMTLTAGPEFKNDAHHMVLWTKQEFEGDVKIEYDYTRLDKENRCVTILYIQATGSGKDEFHKDIAKWNELRKVPAMRTYYNNMNLYHISYAAFGNDGKSTTSYVRARRYMPHESGLKGTDLEPDYFSKTLFATNVKHHITVIKKDRDLFMRIESPEQVYYCHMTNPKLPAITEGRIGLRHMFTRSARYEHIRVSTTLQEQ